MTADDVRDLLEAIVRKFDGEFDPPVERRDDGPPPPEPADWQALEARFGCRFPQSYKALMAVAGDYNIPSLLNVRRDEPRTEHGDRRIDQQYDVEMELGGWNPDLIPFLSIGNGDCFCLSAAGSDVGAVFYFNHEEGEADEVAPSFGAWLRHLEYHLNGTGPAPRDG